MYRVGLLALGLIFTVGAVAIPGAKAADPGFCKKYANEAEQSVSFAKALKCGFQGPRWVGGKGPHFSWYLLVDKGLAQSETDARRADLKACTCQWYADQPMVQIAMNTAKKCGFNGLRWLDDKTAHYNWCFNANPGIAAMKSELSIRKKMLNGY